MKKILAMLLVLAFAFAVVGCGGEANTEEPEPLEIPGEPVDTTDDEVTGSDEGEDGDKDKNIDKSGLTKPAPVDAPDFIFAYDEYWMIAEMVMETGVGIDPELGITSLEGALPMTIEVYVKGEDSLSIIDMQFMQSTVLTLGGVQYGLLEEYESYFILGDESEMTSTVDTEFVPADAAVIGDGNDVFNDIKCSYVDYGYEDGTLAARVFFDGEILVGLYVYADGLHISTITVQQYGTTVNAGLFALPEGWTEVDETTGAMMMVFGGDFDFDFGFELDTGAD